MFTFTVEVILVVLALLLAFGAFQLRDKFRERFAFWKHQGQCLQIPGFVPEPPTFYGRTFLKAICRVATFITVGSIKVTGRQHVKHTGSLAVTPNHTHEPDFMVVGAALRSSYRQLASANAVKGKRAALAAFTGAFAVPVVDGKASGGTAVSVGQLTAEAGAKILGQGNQKVLWFPQGQLYDTILPEQFQTGVIRCAKLVDDDVNLAILPVGIHYLDKPRTRFSVARRAFKFTSYGVNVAIGAPIAVASLPQDARQAIEVVRLEIVRLVELAKTL